MQAHAWPLSQCSMQHILKRKLNFIEAAGHFFPVLYASCHLTTQTLGQADTNSCVHIQSNVSFVLWRHKLIRNFVLVIEFRCVQDRVNYLFCSRTAALFSHIFLKHHKLKCDNKNVHGTSQFSSIIIFISLLHTELRLLWYTTYINRE